jgi:hypothetical protein
MYLDNKYTRWYYIIINNAKIRNNDKITYLENHHIIPESFFINRVRKGPDGWLNGNPEEPNNKVKLTAREHFVCHLLLIKMTIGKGRMKMANALNRIAGKNKNDHVIKITGRMYDIIKQELSKENSGQNNPMYGKTGKLAPCYGRAKEKHPNFGKKMSAESSKRKSEKLTGVPKSIESNKKRSNSHKGKKHDYQLGEKNQCHSQIKNERHPSQIKKTCTHCNITCSSNTYQKYHGINCNIIKPRLSLPKKQCPHCNVFAASSQYSRYHNDNCKFKSDQ